MAPVGNTCPDINKAQRSLQSTIKDAEYAIKRYELSSDTVSIVEAAVDKMSMAIDVLEEMRSANSKLRDWGDQMEQELEDARTELQELRAEKDTRIEELKSEVATLLEQIKTQ